MAQEKDLIRETDWLKIYKSGEKELRYESKCLTQGLQISANFVVSNWGTLTSSEQLEFTIAFCAVPNLSVEDEKILDFLMEAGSEIVWNNLALQYAKHSDKKRALYFLLQQIKPFQRRCANYYQALELLKDRTSVPVLQDCYSDYRKALDKGELKSWQFFDYLQCCRTLSLLGDSLEHKAALEEMLSNSDDMIRRRAAQLLARDKS
jgi:hypothetical protein